MAVKMITFHNESSRSNPSVFSFFIDATTLEGLSESDLKKIGYILQSNTTPRLNTAPVIYHHGYFTKNLGSVVCEQDGVLTVIADVTLPTDDALEEMDVNKSHTAVEINEINKSVTSTLLQNNMYDLPKTIPLHFLLQPAPPAEKFEHAQALDLFSKYKTILNDLTSAETEKKLKDLNQRLKDNNKLYASLKKIIFSQEHHAIIPNSEAWAAYIKKEVLPLIQQIDDDNLAIKKLKTMIVSVKQEANRALKHQAEQRMNILTNAKKDLLRFLHNSILEFWILLLKESKGRPMLPNAINELNDLLKDFASIHIDEVTKQQTLYLSSDLASKSFNSIKLRINKLISKIKSDLMSQQQLDEETNTLLTAANSCTDEVKLTELHNKIKANTTAAISFGNDALLLGTLKKNLTDHPGVNDPKPFNVNENQWFTWNNEIYDVDMAIHAYDTSELEHDTAEFLSGCNTVLSNQWLATNVESAIESKDKLMAALPEIKSYHEQGQVLIASTKSKVNPINDVFEEVAPEAEKYLKLAAKLKISTTSLKAAFDKLTATTNSILENEAQLTNNCDNIISAEKFDEAELYSVRAKNLSTFINNTTKKFDEHHALVVAETKKIQAAIKTKIQKMGMIEAQYVKMETEVAAHLKLGATIKVNQDLFSSRFRQFAEKYSPMIANVNLAKEEFASTISAIHLTADECTKIHTQNSRLFAWDDVNSFNKDHTALTQESETHLDFLNNKFQQKEAEAAYAKQMQAEREQERLIEAARLFRAILLQDVLYWSKLTTSFLCIGGKYLSDYGVKVPHGIADMINHATVITDDKITGKTAQEFLVAIQKIGTAANLRRQAGGLFGVRYNEPQSLYNITAKLDPLQPESLNLTCLKMELAKINRNVRFSTPLPKDNSRLASATVIDRSITSTSYKNTF